MVCMLSEPSKRRVDMLRRALRRRRVWDMEVAPLTIFTRRILYLLLRESTTNLVVGRNIILISRTRGRFIEYVLERPDVIPCWREYAEHDFVSGLADGSLPVETFKYYLIQDYLFLVSCITCYCSSQNLIPSGSIRESKCLGCVQG
jgi:hypothetical protein